MGKGEIAHYEQFFLFPQCFQKACFPGASEGVIVWEGVNLVTRLIFGMKSHSIDTHLLVPRSRSSAKVKVKYQGNISKKKKNGHFRGH